MQQIDSAKHLYLRSIYEPEDNVLLLVVQEAGASGHPKNIQLGETTVSGVQDIVSGEHELAYQIMFPYYISYAVTNESFAIVDDAEVRTGRLFSIYTKSRFLDYVRATMLVTEDFPGPISHFQVNCLNHSIDVVSTSKPEIKVLNSGLLDGQL